jgi:DNA-binding MarR family transcriptional regulator
VLDEHGDRSLSKIDNMVDEKKVNQVVDKGNAAGSGRESSRSGGEGVNGGPESPGYELPLLLFAGFRTLIDRLHAELARQGHPEARPVHGFTLQAIGREGATAVTIGRRLGVSKQAAGKTVDRLVALGYAERTDDPADARRKVVRLTDLGYDLLARSAAIFDRLRNEWATTLGPERVREMEADLRRVSPRDSFGLDAAGWLGGS